MAKAAAALMYGSFLLSIALIGTYIHTMFR